MDSHNKDNRCIFPFPNPSLSDPSLFSNPSLSYSGFTVKIVHKPLSLVAMHRVQPAVTCIIPNLNPNPNP